MDKLDRGFKAWAERTSAGLRKELGLNSCDALHPKDLARCLGVRLCTPRDIPGVPKEVLSQLLEKDPWGWSAVSQIIKGRPLVIYNSRHSAGRQASDIMHELAHIILDHDPGKLIMSQDGAMVMRSYDRKQEEEANWLGWSILLPREALVSAAREGLSREQIAERFGVTEDLVEFRQRMTGVNTQFRKSRRL
jgi:Zn-dependent peptidase ImmA (M78 family)